MYNINDFIIYGSNGICKVEDIGIPEIAGIDRGKMYYKLSPVFSKGSVIYTPIDNSSVNMRKIMSNNEAQELINRIPVIPTIEIDYEKYADKKYKSLINSQDCEELIQVIKTLYLKQQAKISEKKKPSQMNERFLKQAEDLLYGELSIALNIPKDNMKSYIEQRVLDLQS
jgi:CarD family transcriptional regulator